MKKIKAILNNKGVTLVEVIAAAVILSIIIIPLFNTILHTIKINVSSDEEIRMNATIQKILEEVKATGNHSRFKYYDKRFNEVGMIDAYYTVQLVEEKNIIDDNEEYDRWDFDLVLYSGKAVSLKKSGVQLPDSKLFQRDDVLSPVQQDMDTILLDFIGEDFGANPYLLKYGAGIGDEVNFTPGNGAVSGPTDNTIVLNVINEGRTDPFNISVSNNTCYNDYPTVFYMAGGELKFHKHIIVNIFDKNSVVNVSTSSYVDINQRNESSPHIANGDKVTVIVTNNKGDEVKRVNSIIAKDVTLN